MTIKIRITGSVNGYGWAIEKLDLNVLAQSITPSFTNAVEASKAARLEAKKMGLIK